MTDNLAKVTYELNNKSNISLRLLFLYNNKLL